MRAVVLASCAACATATSVCPIGSKRVDVREQQGRAQWCTTTDQRLARLPEPGRSYESALGSTPRPMAGGVQGPFTSWYASGAIESHGHYLDFGSRSVPDGLWAFWYPNGQRWTIGNYHRGEPAGCFAAWDEAGTRSTGFVEGNQLHVAPCTPPADDELAILEGTSDGPPARPVRADISLQGFFGPGSIGARNDLQIDPDPSLQVAMNMSARARLGRLRFGPSAGLRIADNTDYRAFSVGGVLGVGLPVLHPRLDLEASIELGAQYITALAQRPMQLGTADVSFWSPFGAAQASAGLTLTPFLEAVASLRVDGVPAHDVDRLVTYCAFASMCMPAQQETWSVGGFAFGLNLGLRFVLR
jgi:hypothetical protein